MDVTVTLYHIHAIPIPVAGHNLVYHYAIKSVADALGWDYQGWMPKNAPFEPLSEFIFKKLNTFNRPASPFSKIKNIFQNIAPFCKLLGQKRGGKKILLLEHFSICELISLWFASLFAKSALQNTELWLIHRYPPEQGMYNGRPYKILHHCLAWRLGKNQLKLLTDSSLLAEKQSQFYGLPVHVLPIPHTQFIRSCRIEKVPGKLYCWWGTSVRSERGVEEILFLASLLQKGESNLVLILPESLKRESLKNHIHWIADGLDRAEYDAWILSSDITLLPYQMHLYRERTSGVFVESVVAGSIPFVTRGTWMGYELNRFGLMDLSVDWRRPDLLNHIANVCNNPDVLSQLKRLQEDYVKTHSQENFTKTFHRLA